jgi:hypothetical protein
VPLRRSLRLNWRARGLCAGICTERFATFLREWAIPLLRKARLRGIFPGRCMRSARVHDVTTPMRVWVRMSHKIAVGEVYTTEPAILPCDWGCGLRKGVVTERGFITL